MTLSLLLASTLLAAPAPSFPAGDECPNCGHSLPDDLDARIERVVRRVLAESGAKAPVARTSFGLKTLAEVAPEARARGLFVTDDGEVHEFDFETDDVVFGVSAPRAPGAPDAPHPPHAIRIRKDDGDGKETKKKIVIRSDGDVHEIHGGHDGPNVFRVRASDGAPHEIRWTSDDGKHEVQKEKKVEVRVHAGGGSGGGAPKTFTRTITVGPDGVVHDSHEGNHDILHSIHANELHGLHEELQSGLHGIHVELEGLEGLKELKGLEGLKGLEKLEGLKVLHEIEGLEGLKELEGLKALQHIEGLEGLGVVLERVDGEGGFPHVWHADGGEMDFTFDVEVSDEGDGGAPRIVWKSDSKDVPAPEVENRFLRRATRSEAAVDETEAQIEALNAEIEALEKRLERLLKQAGNS